MKIKNEKQFRPDTPNNPSWAVEIAVAILVWIVVSATLYVVGNICFPITQGYWDFENQIWIEPTRGVFGNIITNGFIQFIIGMAAAIGTFNIISHIPSRAEKRKVYKQWQKEEFAKQQAARAAKAAEEARIKAEEEKRKLEFEREKKRVQEEKERKEEEGKREEYFNLLKQHLIDYENTFITKYGEEGTWYKGDKWFEEEYGSCSSSTLDSLIHSSHKKFETAVQKRVDEDYRKKYGEQAYFAMLRDRREQEQLEELKRHNKQVESDNRLAIQQEAWDRQQAMIQAQRQADEQRHQMQQMVQMQNQQNKMLEKEAARKAAARESYKSSVQASHWSIDSSLKELARAKAEQKIADLL